MDKIITYTYGDHDSEVFKLLHPGSLSKTAEYSSSLLEFIKDLMKKDNHTYALVNALSAGEFYGANKNGDYFPQDALRDYHKTFEAMGHVYKHHINKDPQKSMGKVVFSNYNPKMKRVELILELDNSKSGDILEKLESGKLPAVSMGCKVPYDVCSICNNKAKTRAQYCDHLLKEMNQTYSDGRKVFAINTMPKFFDLSVVTIPADRTAGFINKVAEHTPDNTNFKDTVNLGERNFQNYISKTAGFEANADIKKKIPVKVTDIDIVKNKGDLDRLVGPMNMEKKSLDKLAQYPFKTVLSTCLGLGILPHRADFQKLALLGQGLSNEAEQFENEGVVFEVTPETEVVDLEGVSLDGFNDEVAHILAPEVTAAAITKEAQLTRALVKVADADEWSQKKPGERGYLRKFFMGTPDDVKTTSHKNPVAPLGMLASLYYSYSQLMQDGKSLTGFKKFLHKKPWVLPLLVGAGTVGSLKAQDYAFKKINQQQFGKEASYVTSAAISIPVSYYFSAVAEEKARRGIPIGGKENFIRKHPAITSILGAWGGGKALKALKKVKNPFKKASPKPKKKKGWFSKKAETNSHRDYSMESKVAHLVNQLDGEALDTLYNDLLN